MAIARSRDNVRYCVFLLQGGSAKKPYNPILGETFHCFWDLPSAQRTPPDETTKVTLTRVQRKALCYPTYISLQRLLETGPVPYANPDALAYVAEQVSHHPPGEY